MCSVEVEDETVLKLQELPSAGWYEKSFSHPDQVLHVLLTKTNFIITADSEGVLKFWRKQPKGIVFVKRYQAHLSSICGLSVSLDGFILCSTALDKSIKVFDVLAFDLIHSADLSFVPSTCHIINRTKNHPQYVAIGDQSSGSIHVFKPKHLETSVYTIKVHKHPVLLMRHLLALDAMISVDTKGMLELWNLEDGSLPSSLAFKMKSETDLFVFVKMKVKVFDLVVSSDEKTFFTLSSDHRIRIFDTISCTIQSSIDVSPLCMGKVYQIEDTLMKRMLQKETALFQLIEEDPLFLSIPRPTLSLSSSGAILAATVLGIHCFDVTSGESIALIGRNEDKRFMGVQLFQGDIVEDSARTAAYQKMDHPRDPTVFATAVKAAKLFLFSRREPKDQSSRDIQNEPIVPSSRHRKRKTVSESLETDSVILFTSKGDIHLKLYPEHCPKTVENFVTLAKDGYYDHNLFHRVIKNFMIQSGDPSGEGTGGESIWGRPFEDEIVDSLRHDCSGTLSMANSGTNSNGSQFFITTVPCPWLDGKHTVFGRVSKGLEVVHAIEAIEVDDFDKPIEEVRIINCGLESNGV